MGKAFLAGNGSIWIQPDGPNTQPYYLGCHTLSNLDRSRGDAQLVYIPNVEQPNDWIPFDIFQQGGPGPVETSIQFAVREDADWLEIIDCPVPLYVNLVDCGRKDVFANWSRSFILDKTIVTNESATNLSVADPDDQDRSGQSVDLAAKNFHNIFRLRSAKQKSVSVVGRTAVSIDFLGTKKCYGVCGNLHSKNQTGFIGLEGLVAGAGNVYYTNDGGLVWSPTAASPFQSHEDVSGLGVVETSSNSYVIIAARGTVDALNPFEIAYSSDAGASWTNLDVGSVNGQYAIGKGNSLFDYNSTNIWIVTTGGYIYHSDNVGQSWIAQEAGSLTIQDLYAVHFSSDEIGVAVGASNTILQTTDGKVWGAVTAPVAEVGNIAKAVFVFDRNRFWVGYDSGNVYFTNDRGSTWTERDFPGSGLGEVQDVKFCNDYVGNIVSLSTGGTVGNIFRTINGGWTWETQSLPSGTGPLYDLHVCNCNQIYAVGDF